MVTDPDICNMLNLDSCDASMDWFTFFRFEDNKLPIPTCVLGILLTQRSSFSITGPPLDDLAAFIFPYVHAVQFFCYEKLNSCAQSIY